MILSTDTIFLTDDVAGFRECRETRSAHSTTIIFCYAGQLQVVLNGQTYVIGPNDLFIRIPYYNTELGPYQYSDDFRFIQLTVEEHIFTELMYDHMRVEPRWWSKQEYLRQNPVFHLHEASIQFCEAYFELLRLQLSDRLSDYRQQILMAIARAASMEILNYLDKVLTVPDGAERLSVNSSDYIFQRFINLLQQYPHQREVQWFAAQIRITPKYLSEICKARSGKSASEWIAEVTISEIKHRLRHTSKPIRDIAREMEFPNPSFFCQYTKKHTGVSPNKLRKEKHD